MWCASPVRTIEPLPLQRDIADAQDVHALVTRFYTTIMEDAVIGHFFTHLALSAHLPRIEAFWCMVLFGDRNYRGDPMAAHIALDKRHRMEPEHFDRWLGAWEASTDGLFAGPLAEQAKERARSIAPLMLHKVRQARSA